ncbi:hypothetical protein IW262DRAFT_1302898 [Armillaria fumosa]|nr:hypothetical protein IW262DRAFT_1302898 [Armillaria fumosa]
MFNVKFVPVHDTPLSDICNNLIWVHAVSACYFELTTRNAAPTGELIRAVTKAHDYLDAHMDILANFNFADSCYGLALHAAIGLLISHIPEDLQCREWNKWALKYQLDEALLLPREDGYEAHGDSSMLESDVRPFCIITLPPPRCPTATPSPTSGKKFIGVILPPTGSALGSPNILITGASSSEKVAGPSWSKPSPMPVRSHAKSTVGPAPVKSQLCKVFRKSPTPRADKVVITTKKPTFDPSSDSEAPESSVNGEGPGDDLGPLFYLSNNDLLSDEVPLPPPKHTRIASPGHEESLLPPPHVYHPLTGEPLPGLRGFHPHVDLQFHEPPSREALEHLKLSALPAVPTSLLKPLKQIRQGREYIYQCHLDENPYFI